MDSSSFFPAIFLSFSLTWTAAAFPSAARLSAPHYRDREAAQQTLARLGPFAMPAVAVTLRSSDPEARQRARAAVFDSARCRHCVLCAPCRSGDWCPRFRQPWRERDWSPGGDHGYRCGACDGRKVLPWGLWAGGK